MTLPEQIPHVSDDRAAIAPYNFVPLPEKIVPAELPLPTHDAYHEGRHTGRIACTLTTASPLYVRCGLTPEQLAQGLEAKDLPDFFYLQQHGQPVIPGSSLRGMLRALVEIAGYGKMDRVMNRQLFYRSVSDQDYQRLFVEDCGRIKQGANPLAHCFRTKIRTGFLRLRRGKYVIEECDFARIDHQANPRGIAQIPSINNASIFQGNGPGRKPNWVYQNKRIHVVVDQQEQDYFFPVQYRPNGQKRHPDLYLRFRAVKQANFVDGQIPNTQEATLVITGHMQNKHMEFVFLHNMVATHQIDHAMVQRFEDTDQLTQWQEDAFPQDRPVAHARRDGGLLRDGEPVFFLMDDSELSVRFFGRAQLFRLPYGAAPFDLVPMASRRGQEDDNQPPVTDIAEAIFGHVSRNSKDDPRKPIAGRVFVGDALYVGAKDGVWLNEVTPHILGSPKPTTYQHYLVQPSETNAEQHKLMRYDSDLAKTTIRGHKLYWHKKNIGEADIREIDEQKIQSAPKQYTKFKPVKAGVSFTFTIRFENLSNVELGALLWVLQIAADERYRLKLGMGKPLGMGAVKIESKVVLSKREERYRALFDGKQPGWLIGEFEEYDREPYLNAFHNHVLATLKAHDPEKFNYCSKIDETLRIQCLLALLNWEDAPPVEQTRYMEIERDATDRNNVIPAARNQNPRRKRLPNGQYIDVINEYSSRPVLPSPVQLYSENNRSPGTAEVEERLPAPVSGARTVRARVGGVGANDASVGPLDGGKPGRARFAPNLPRKPSSGDLVVVQLDAEGKPEVIVAFL